MCSPKKLTINLAIESIDSLKKKASKLKDIECPKVHVDPCIKRVQVIPAPIRRIEKRQIEICKCPTVEFICPPVPCVCPPCPICPTPAERFKALLKAGLKLSVLYVMVKWTVDQELWGGAEHTSQLTNYYKSIVNALVYGEQRSNELALQSTTPGFFEIRKVVYNTQLIWNKIISTIFYVTIGLPYSYVHKMKESFSEMLERDDEDDEMDEID